MEYRLNLYTPNSKFFQIEIAFKDVDTTTYPLSLYPMQDENGVKIYDTRRNGYQLILRSPIPLDEDSLTKIYNEIKRSVTKDIFEVTPRFVEILSKSQYDMTFSDCFEKFGQNILCSRYPNNNIEKLTNDFIECKIIKRLNYDGPIIQVNPEQEVFRLSHICHKDVFPNVHCVLQDNIMNVFENTLDHKRTEQTVYVIHDDYISLSPHVGYIQTRDDLFVWFVSSHILVANLSERQTQFDPTYKYMTKINTSNLLERFQEILRTLNFITVSTIYNRSIYSYESRTLVFIGDFPGDAVTSDIKEKYLSFIQNEYISN